MSAPDLSKIGFVGLGSMADAIIRGILKSGVDPSFIFGSNPSEGKRVALGELGINTNADNQYVLDNAGIVFLCVKPQKIEEVSKSLKVRDGSVVVSIMAGVPMSRLQELLNAKRMVRVMPNTPMLAGEGACGIIGNEHAQQCGDVAAVSALLRPCAPVVVECEREEQLHAVTGVSGSGPAYVVRFM
eukprot:TRINITY_DN12818_c0_g1_i1.p1 TRINITY_DN12818_c0_g1~~TRINITY_DN12818_c0_g1_i1.p1  ORF type:complete len:186 (+),score=54.95 TRINITY_DN12818_c0_g1_i1:158-715(+)